MPLFFNRNFNNNQRKFLRCNFFNNQNNMFNDQRNFMGFTRQPQNNANPILNQQYNNEIVIKPLTKEELEKINDEIKENIEKNKKTILPINESNEKDKIIKYLKEFIQDEKNGSIFYKSLSNNCNNKLYKDKLINISNECSTESKNLINLYKSLKNEEFEPKNININTNIPFKTGLLFAIEEEIKSYDRICNILDKLPPENTRNFYKIALKKLSRINSIQYMAMDKNI